MSGFRCQVSLVICHVPGVVCLYQTVKPRDITFWEYDHFLPSLTCHMSYVMCQVSGVISKKKYMYIYVLPCYDRCSSFRGVIGLLYQRTIPDSALGWPSPGWVRRRPDLRSWRRRSRCDNNHWFWNLNPACQKSLLVIKVTHAHKPSNNWSYHHT